MIEPGERILLRVYLQNADRAPLMPTHERLVRAARKAGMAGATVFTGILGAGDHGILKPSRWSLIERVPVIVEIVDSADRLVTFMRDTLDPLMVGGMVTLERAAVMMVRHRAGVAGRSGRDSGAAAGGGSATESNVMAKVTAALGAAVVPPASDGPAASEPMRAVDPGAAGAGAADAAPNAASAQPAPAPARAAPDGSSAVAGVRPLSLYARIAPLSTVPGLHRGVHMTVNENGVLLRIFIGESDRFEAMPLYEAIVQKVRELGLGGATVLRGTEGFGASSIVHKAALLELSADLPVVIEIVDSDQKINLLLPHLEAMVKEGMITMEHVVIVLYRHREQVEAGG